MPMVPTGYVHLGQLEEAVNQVSKSLGPEVLHVAYRIRPDSTDEPSIFFRVLLADAYIQEDTLVDLTIKIADAFLDGVRPIENWGLRPYFNYRSKSEQDRRPDPDWI